MCSPFPHSLTFPTTPDQPLTPVPIPIPFPSYINAQHAYESMHLYTNLVIINQLLIKCRHMINVHLYTYIGFLYITWIHILATICQSMHFTLPNTNFSIYSSLVQYITNILYLFKSVLILKPLNTCILNCYSYGTKFI